MCADVEENPVARAMENGLRLLAACFYEPDKALFMEEHLLENLL